jgi:rifampicin phosphotransferase
MAAFQTQVSVTTGRSRRPGALSAHARLLDAMSVPRLLELVDQVATAAGDYFGWIGVLAAAAAAAYKTEIPLAAFCRRHLASTIGGSHQHLLAGVGGSPRPVAHAVTSLDWLRPTLGELADVATSASAELEERRIQ